MSAGGVRELKVLSQPALRDRWVVVDGHAITADQCKLTHDGYHYGNAIVREEVAELLRPERGDASAKHAKPSQQTDAMGHTKQHAKHGKDLTEANKDDGSSHGSSQRPPDQMDAETKELMKHMRHVKRMTEPNKDGGFSQRAPDEEDMDILKQMQKELDGAQAALVTMATGLNITNEELGD